ncbi:MAG: CHAD domain-containing protein [Rhizomicrobium sp.]
MAKEVELKLIAAPRVLSMAARQPWLRALATGKARTEKLVSVYFDTSKCDLRRHDVSLRIRTIGRRRLQTVKTATNGSALGRGEWEQEIDGDVPDLALAKNTPLGSLLSGKKGNGLHPVFETAVERKSLPLRYGSSDIELAIDRGWIRAGGRRERIGEIELELKDGDPADLAKMAKRLADTVRVSWGARAKAERGYALSDGLRHAAFEATDIRLAVARSCGEAFGVIGQSCLHHFAANNDAVRKGDTHGIHQMRVGLRRLRAAISVFKDMLAGAETEEIKSELKWLTGQLAPARDYDVLLRDSLVPLRDAEPDSPEIALLAAEIERRRDSGIADAKATVASARYRTLVLRTALWLAAGDWTEDADALALARRETPVAEFARDALARRTGKILKKSGKLSALDAHKRHKLRISVKKLRYATEFFADLFATSGGTKARRHFEAAVKALQQALGRLNDITTHEKLAHEFATAAARNAQSAPEAYAMGYLTGREQKTVRTSLADARKARKKLSDAEPFW